MEYSFIIEDEEDMCPRFQKMMYRPNGIRMEVFFLCKPFLFFSSSRLWNADQKWNMIYIWSWGSSYFVCMCIGRFLGVVSFIFFCGKKKKTSDQEKKIYDIWHFEVYLFRIDTVNISILSSLGALILMRVSSGGTALDFIKWTGHSTELCIAKLCHKYINSFRIRMAT